MNGEERQWPVPNPRALPPSKPTHSHVSDGIGGLGGRDRAWEPSHGTSYGGCDRTWEFSHGRHGAFICQGTRRPLPTPGFLPPSNPHPSKVGEGVIIQGYTDIRGGGALSTGGGGAAATRPGGEGASMTFGQVLDLLSKNNPSQPTSSSSEIPLQINHPEIRHPTKQGRISHVWCFVFPH